MVIVRAFARYRELLGFQSLELPWSDRHTLGVLLDDPRFKALPAEALLAVNQVRVLIVPSLAMAFCP